MPKYENDKFLSELTKLFQSALTSGSVVVTMKKYDGRSKPTPKNRKYAAGRPSGDHHEVTEYFCLMRAALGNKKISTVVAHRDLTRFQLAYANLLRGNMHSLKKKGRGGAGGKSKQTV